MAIGEVTGICKISGKEFTVRKKFNKRKEADSFESNMQGYYDECPECYGKRKYAEKHKEKDSEPIIAKIRIAEIESTYPFKICLTGGTYPAKEQIKELGYKWDSYNREWAKTIPRENLKKEILSLKAIKATNVYDKTTRNEYNAWLKAHGENE